MPYCSDGDTPSVVIAESRPGGHHRRGQRATYQFTLPGVAEVDSKASCAYGVLVQTNGWARLLQPLMKVPIEAVNSRTLWLQGSRDDLTVIELPRTTRAGQVGQAVDAGLPVAT